ncbi:MAG: hypothetical protein Q9207_006352 [Kuettlingeria erythrocarpa]
MSTETGSTSASQPAPGKGNQSGGGGGDGGKRPYIFPWDLPLCPNCDNKQHTGDCPPPRGPSRQPAAVAPAPQVVAAAPSRAFGGFPAAGAMLGGGGLAALTRSQVSFNFYGADAATIKAALAATGFGGAATPVSSSVGGGVISGRVEKEKKKKTHRGGKNQKGKGKGKGKGKEPAKEKDEDEGDEEAKAAASTPLPPASPHSQTEDEDMGETGEASQGDGQAK